MKILKRLYHKAVCKKIVYDNVLKRDKYNDRRVLEEIIIPRVLADFDPKKILDIGREDYQIFYNKFFKNRELWTMDIDPERAEYGAEGKFHITDDAANVKNHFTNDYFDFILINGVLGWGLDSKAKIEQAFTGLFDILKPKGLLIIGWNDFEDTDTMRPHQIKALKKFKAYNFKPLGGAEFECDNGCHKYSFLLRNDAQKKSKFQISKSKSNPKTKIKNTRSKNINQIETKF